MSEPESHNIYNLPDDQVKMPENNFSAPEAATGKLQWLPILIVTTVLLLAALAGLIYWGWDILVPTQPVITANVPTETPAKVANTQPTDTPVEPAVIDDPNALSQSDQIKDIETDLANTNTNNLTAELSAIEAEFGN